MNETVHQIVNYDVARRTQIFDKRDSLDYQILIVKRESKILLLLSTIYLDYE